MSDYARARPGYRELTVSADLRLIEPDLGHAPHSLRWLSDERVGRYMGADFSDVAPEREERRIREIRDNLDERNWMIEWRGAVIGNTSLNAIEETTRKLGVRAGTLAVLIGERSHWGKGIGPAVCAAVTDWAFREGGFAAVAARALVQNAASIRMLEKAGFRVCGTEIDGEAEGKPAEWLLFRLDAASGAPR